MSSKNDDLIKYLSDDGKGISLDGEYLGSKIKTSFRCLSDHVWEATPTNIKQGTGCPTCFRGRQTSSKDDFVQWLTLNGKGFAVIGEYVNTYTKTTFQCKNNHTWEATPANVKKGSGCPNCSKNHPTTEEFKKWLLADGRGIMLIGNYVTGKIKTQFECGEGHVWSAAPHHIKDGIGCPECSQKLMRATTSEFSQWLSSNATGILIVGEYVTANTRTEFECYLGHRWITTPASIKSGTGCPTCATYGFKPNEPAWEYAFARDGYVKFGITNDLVRRLTEHRRHGEITMVHERYHSVGQLALEWENNIKRTYGGRYATKEQCPDGYTETLPMSVLLEITGTINTP